MSECGECAEDTVCFCDRTGGFSPEIEMDVRAVGSVLLLPIQLLFHTLRACARLLLPGRRRDLTGDVVLITGGGRGIGRHLAKEFSKNGAKKVKSGLSVYL